MKITFQNPTKGPLITVSFDDEAAAASWAFSLIGASRVTAAASDGLATLRTAAQFAETAPGATGGTAGGMGNCWPGHVYRDVFCRRGFASTQTRN
jgi:hypothetical protein